MDLDEKVMERLKGVMDPETGMNVVEMELVKDLAATKKGKVSLKFRPSSFDCPLAFKLAFDIYKALKTVEEVKEVDVEVVDCVYAEEINSFLRTGEI